MKLRIGNYEVKIKARNMRFNEKMNPEDTMCLLNILSDALRKSGDSYKASDLNGVANEMWKLADDIYEYLNNKAYYDDVKEVIR